MAYVESYVGCFFALSVCVCLKVHLMLDFNREGRPPLLGVMHTRNTYCLLITPASIKPQLGFCQISIPAFFSPLGDPVGGRGAPRWLRAPPGDPVPPPGRCPDPGIRPPPRLSPRWKALLGVRRSGCLCAFIV